MNLIQAAVLYSAIILAVQAVDGPPIKCYQCNSNIKGEEDCLQLLNKDPATMLVPKTCDTSVYGKTPFCRKTVLTVYVPGGIDEQRTYRGCGWVMNEQPCYRSANGDHTEKTCQCFEDGCNSALFGATVSNINLVATVLIGFLLSYYYK